MKSQGLVDFWIESSEALTLCSNTNFILTPTVITGWDQFTILTTGGPGGAGAGIESPLVSSFSEQKMISYSISTSEAIMKSNKMNTVEIIDNNLNFLWIKISHTNLNGVWMWGLLLGRLRGCSEKAGYRGGSSSRHLSEQFYNIFDRRWVGTTSEKFY